MFKHRRIVPIYTILDYSPWEHPFLIILTGITIGILFSLGMLLLFGH